METPDGHRPGMTTCQHFTQDEAQAMLGRVVWTRVPGRGISANLLYGCERFNLQNVGTQTCGRVSGGEGHL